MGNSSRGSNGGGTVSNSLDEYEYEEFTTENGKHTINVRQISDPYEFLNILKENNKNISEEKRWRVDVMDTPEDMEEWIKDHPGVKMYVTENGTTGAVMPNGDMIALSSSKGGEGSAMFEWQINNGGRFLDSYDGNYGMYRHLGFVPVSYTPFNPEYVKGWKPEYGAEDVVFMVYGGKQAKSNMTPKQMKDDLKMWKQSHPAQYDSVNDKTGKEEWGYDKAEHQRTEFVKDNKVLEDIWRMEGLE